jgi:excisionase family DNA binding protein
MLEKKLLTRKEAAEYMGVRPETLAVWHCTRRYKLPVVKVGRSVRYRLADLERWLAARTVVAVGSQSEGGAR